MLDSRIVRITNGLTINMEDLREFLLYAKPLGYAAENPSTILPTRPCFKDLAPIRRGLWVYQESYAGYVQAPGQDWVTYDSTPVWMMGKAGGMVGMFQSDIKMAQEVYTVLKEALRQPNPDLPLRGPERYKSGSYTYYFSFKGDLSFFRGEENVNIAGYVRPFHQYVCGGLVIH